MIEKASSNDFLGRFREIVSDPLNLLIERHPLSGIVKDNLVYLHNGNTVPISGAYAYYDQFSSILAINRGVHEPLEEYVFQELLKVIHQKPIMLELGAYWGHYSMWLKKVYPNSSVYLVEPDESNIKAGMYNFRRHGYEGEFIHAFVGKGKFEVDTFFRNKKLSRIDILHADIQGYEIDMLDGSSEALRNKSIDYLFISTHSQNLHRDVIKKLDFFEYRTEVSSDFENETTSFDGFIFASNPIMQPVFENFKPLDRTQIIDSNSVTVINSLVNRILIQPNNQRNQKDDTALNLAGLIAYQHGHYDSAIQLFGSAIQLNDCDHNYHNNLGAALRERGNLKEAISCFQRAIDLKPGYSDASYNLGMSHQAMGQFSQAANWYESTLLQDPKYFKAYKNLSCIYREMGMIDKAVEGFMHAIRYDPCDAAAHSSLLHCLNYLEGADPDMVFRNHQEWQTRHAPDSLIVLRNYSNQVAPNRRIRIGYVSPDFYNHPNVFFILPAIQNHDSEQIEVWCYADVSQLDDFSQLVMNTSDHWQNIYQMSDEQVFDCIQKDQIDILVDLTGHSTHNRMKLFAKKSAPIQISYLGYPNTTGLSVMDYRITDAVADPPGLTDPYYSEELIRLPDGFLCYQPSFQDFEISDSPCLKNGYITFGYFNSTATINSTMIALWSDLMKKVADSRLILKFSMLSDPDSQQRLLLRFIQHGIKSDRIEIVQNHSHVERLHDFQRVDICLDSFPYNGWATACEALWMGVPVITLAGNTHASRITASILSQLGLSDWIVTSINNYLDVLVTHTNRIDNLQSLHRSLRQTMQASSLMDQKQIVTKLEIAYRKMWEKWCVSIQKPDQVKNTDTLNADMKDTGKVMSIGQKKKRDSINPVKNILKSRQISKNEKADTCDIHPSKSWLIANKHGHPDVMNVVIRNDITICVPNSIQYMTPYILLEYQDWFEQEIDFVRVFLRPGMKVLDIGANYGTYTLAAAKGVGSSGSVWAFEPSQLTAAYLTRSLRLNQLDNVTLIQAGVSDGERQAFLSLNPNSELNQVAEKGTAGDQESIELVSLDGWMQKTETMIDFMKMDAEGQEDNIIKGGKHFFASCSPLILYEIKHGDDFHLELIQSFMDIGYLSYRLIPGLNILVPFSIGEKLDTYQLNLFCCKSDCAERLEQQGLLINQNQEELLLASVPATLWIDYFQEFPYVLQLLPVWQSYCQKNAGDPDWKVHQQALSAYSVSQLPGYNASDRYWSLKKGYCLMTDLIHRRATVSRILTATRMAIDLGCRSDAVAMLNHLYNLFESGRELSVDEPFLSVSGRMAAINPGNDIGQWLVYSVLETREIYQAFSSYFTGKKSLENLELMKSSPFYSEMMERRRQLIRKRFGITDF